MHTLDNIDRKILGLLQENCRYTTAELAEKVGLSATPCARRVKQLEENGIINRYVTLLNAKSLGYDLQVHIAVGMDKHTPDRFEVFQAAIQTMDEVLECNLVAGQSEDYLLKVLVRDMAHYERFLLDGLTKIPGVTGVHSSFVLRSVMNKTALPLPKP